MYLIGILGTVALIFTIGSEPYVIRPLTSLSMLHKLSIIIQREPRSGAAATTGTV